tara:strand:- start:473 stop:793 length:321 start_codon:yes stop_codon:yes gene_type:complete
MVYALNVFNIKSGMEDTYRKYSVLAGKIIYSKGGRVISSGINPIRNMHGDLERKYMIVVEFPSEEVFQEFIDEADVDNIHHLREDSTSDYIWTLYENWNIKEWVNK